MPQFQITTQAPLVAFISIFFLLGGTLFLLFGFGIIRSGTGEGITIIIQQGRPTIIVGVIGIILGVIGLSGVIPIPESQLITPTSLIKSTYLSELQPRTTVVGFKTFSVGKYEFSSPGSDNIKEGDPIIAHGTQYSYGLYAHAPSKLTYELNGQFSELVTTITMVEWIGDGDGAVFVIKLDGEEIFRSPKMFTYSEPENIKVSVVGGQLLELITEQGDTNIADWTIWGDPVLR